MDDAMRKIIEARKVQMIVGLKPGDLVAGEPVVLQMDENGVPHFVRAEDRKE